MNRLAFLVCVVFIIACNNQENSPDTQQRDLQTFSVDTLTSATLRSAKFRFFDTTVDFSFWEARTSLSDCQQKNYEGFVAKQDQLGPMVLNKLFEYYKSSYETQRSEWIKSGNTDKEIEEFLPRPSSAENLKKFIFPIVVHVPAAKNCAEGTIGIAFDCEWDEENGLGVLIKDWKVVKVGTAQTAYF